MTNTYKNAGVNIQAGDETVQRIKGYAKSTFNKSVLSEIGMFGGFYEIDLTKYRKPVLVSSVDGVGTKLKIAIELDKHETIGQDLVNHCVNDIAVCGAEPLYFLDYLAFGKLIPTKAESIIKGFSIACKKNGCALIGGETAEMPGLYDENDYDLSGTIVGIVEKDEIINGSRICSGDLLIGFASNGLHTNGYSLARHVLQQKFSFKDYLPIINNVLGDELLKVHKSYLPLIKQLKQTKKIKGISHITGGGIIGNTKRIIPTGLSLSIDWDKWELPTIFQLIKETGNIDDEEMRQVFNCGIGLIAVVAKTDLNVVLEAASVLNENGIVLGKVE
ncbi:MAG: phosphoribosylformylglycinamidine cyclo-ligase [Ignavibacteria bacterium]|nr:phosphoribosylformylglycinamidine cyclo-ligase [Ignavibacteria bacterium]